MGGSPLSVKKQSPMFMTIRWFLTGVGMSIYHKFCLSTFNFKVLYFIHLFLILDTDLTTRFCWSHLIWMHTVRNIYIYTIEYPYEDESSPHGSKQFSEKDCVNSN